MSDRIQAILFDVGGTLRHTVKRDAEEKKAILSQILEVLSSDIDLGEFVTLLEGRAEAYNHWADETLLAVDETELWTRWLLPDWPTDKVRENALVFNRIWRDAIGTRPLLPETKDVILHLFRSGYRLGVVSNTLSSEETPSALKNAALAGCFEVIVLSCQVGIRKPNPDIFLNATERMGIDPARCAYVGNNPKRDVVSARKAGFGKTIIVRSHAEPEQSFDDPALIPDHWIENLLELADIFPPLGKNWHLPVYKHTSPFGANGSQIFNASISTMWGVKKFPRLDDSFIAAGRMGFSQIELNHMINSAMLAGIGLAKYRLSSIHEPCPADISTDMLKKKDWMISSINEECRRQGVAAIKRSIDLANELGVKTIVTHAGHVDLDASRENQLRELYKVGQVYSPRYAEIKADMENFRAKNAEPHLEAVTKSLRELLEYAGRNSIRLGLENRYHYLDIPSQDEMGRLLELADSERLGFIYDSGHATAMSLLGFFDHEAWLKRFSGRIIGTHLQDAKGVDDHYAPGLGEIDFGMIAQYLPRDAFRTCEVQSFNSTEQVKNSLRYLVDMGCIDPI